MASIRGFRLRERLRTSLWFVPALCLAAALVLGFAVPSADRALGGGSLGPLAFRGGADSARAALATIAASIITFTGLVFSITMVVLQLASAQFSPRVMRTFLRDPTSSVALGIFTGTFAYAIVVLRQVHGEEEPGGPFVPGLAVSLSFVLVVVSLAVFVRYIDHVAQSIRVPWVLRAVARETTEVIERCYPPGPAETLDLSAVAGPPRRTVAMGPEAAVVQGTDDLDLVDLACEGGCTLALVPAVGDFVPAGAPLFRVHGPGDVDDDRARKLVAFGEERTARQDVAFGFRQLVDIAERALSPAVNDPTTAVQALDQVHDLLRRLATRPTPPGALTDERGVVRLVVPVADFEDYVALGLDEVRHYGRASVQVDRRLRALLADLLTVVPPERRPVLCRQLALLDAAVGRSFEDADDRLVASRPSTQGHGH